MQNTDSTTTETQTKSVLETTLESTMQQLEKKAETLQGQLDKIEANVQEKKEKEEERYQKSVERNRQQHLERLKNIRADEQKRNELIAAMDQINVSKTSFEVMIEEAQSGELGKRVKRKTKGTAKSTYGSGESPSMSKGKIEKHKAIANAFNYSLTQVNAMDPVKRRMLGKQIGIEFSMKGVRGANRIKIQEAERAARIAEDGKNTYEPVTIKVGDGVTAGTLDAVAGPAAPKPAPVETPNEASPAKRESILSRLTK